MPTALIIMKTASSTGHLSRETGKLMRRVGRLKILPLGAVRIGDTASSDRVTIWFDYRFDARNGKGIHSLGDAANTGPRYIARIVEKRFGEANVTNRKRTRWGPGCLSILLAPGLALRTNRSRARSTLWRSMSATPGAESRRDQRLTGIPEYEFNLKIAKKLESTLQATGTIKAFLIASRNRALPERTGLPAGRNADLFDLVHHGPPRTKYLEAKGGRQQGARYTDKVLRLFHFRFAQRTRATRKALISPAKSLRDEGESHIRYAPSFEAIAVGTWPIIDPDAGVLCLR